MADPKDKQSKAGAQQGTPDPSAPAGAPPTPPPATDQGGDSPGVLEKLTRRVRGGARAAETAKEAGSASDPFVEAFRAFLCAHQDALADAQGRHTRARHTLAGLQQDAAVAAQRRLQSAQHRYVQELTDTARETDAPQRAATAYNDFVREQRDAWAEAQQAAQDATQSHAGEAREIQEETAEALRTAYRAFVTAHKAAFAALDDDADPRALSCAAQGLAEVARWAATSLPSTQPGAATS